MTIFSYPYAMIDSIKALEDFFDSHAPSLNTALRDNRLERMRLLLKHLGNPEDSFRAIHIAGSKGKGSTAAYISKLLEASGKRTGLYMSPHLCSIKERFTLSAAFFPEEAYIEAGRELEDAISGFSLPSDLGPSLPTTFELYTAYAYMLFRKEGCTHAVIETGLGGRLDATNTIMPIASVIMPIELEHTAVLGSTLSEIAYEKSKIIKRNVPVFISNQRKEAMDVLVEEARSQSAPLFLAESEIRDLESCTKADGEHVSFMIDDSSFSITLRMATKAMAENASVAILAAKRLGFLTEAGIREMEALQLPGRFERTVYKGRNMVFDVAHTARSIRAAREAFSSIYCMEESTLLFSLIEGKDDIAIMKEIIPHFARIIISKPGTFRKSNIERLYEEATTLFPDKDIMLIPDSHEAVSKAMEGKGDILITGSFYLASAIKEALWD